MGGLTKRKFFSHSSRGWKSGIRVPAWSGSGESSLTGLQTATSLLCAHMEERETRSSLMYLFFFDSSHGMCGEGNGTPLQYSCLENPMDGGAWRAAVHGVARSQTRLGNFTFTFHFHALEKEMATHSSVLAWRIPGMGEPGGRPSMGSHRVGHY